MENLKLDDFTKYKFLSGISMSPAGSNTGFVLHQMDVEENKYLSNIYIYNELNKEPLKLTSLDEEASFLWKDDDTILFPGTRNKKDKEKKKNGEDLTSYYEISLKGGEANKVFEVPLNVTSLEILDDENLILTAVYDHNKPNLDGLSDSEKEKTLKEMKDAKDYEIFDEIPFWSNGQGYTNKKRNRLYKYNIKTKTLLPITDVFTSVMAFELNKEKTKVLLICKSYTDKMQLKSDIHLYDIEKDQLEKLGYDDDFSYYYLLNHNIFLIRAHLILTL